MATITSANSVLMLGVAKLYNVPIKIEGFATDDAFTAQDVETAENMMGVDGNLSSGYVPNPTIIEITLQADSPSNDFFDALITAEKVAREKYVLNGSILIPATSRLYALTRGFIGKVSVMPAAKKVLQPRKFEITFQSVIGAPV